MTESITILCYNTARKHPAIKMVDRGIHELATVTWALADDIYFSTSGGIKNGD